VGKNSVPYSIYRSTPISFASALVKQKSVTLLQRTIADRLMFLYRAQRYVVNDQREQWWPCLFARTPDTQSKQSVCYRNLLWLESALSHYFLRSRPTVCDSLYSDWQNVILIINVIIIIIIIIMGPSIPQFLDTLPTTIRMTFQISVTIDWSLLKYT